MKAEYKHIKAEIHNFQHWIEETRPEELRSIFDDLLHKSNFTILSFHEHYFEHQGYTCFWLLAESHLAIHTFPESSKSYIELSSCNATKLKKFKALLEI